MNNGWVEGIKKKKVIVTLLVMILVFPLVWTESSQAAGDTYIITPEVGGNLRAEPKQEGATVTKLKQGYRVEVLEESGEWLKVSYEGKQGYVKSEYLKPLDIDLVAAYKHYAAVLEETMGEWTYSLLYDFTQDGLEELYIVDYEDGAFRHRMFSGEIELLDEIFYEGLDIYWDDNNYYLVVSLGEIGKAGELYTPDQFDINSEHEFVEVGISGESIYIIQPGNLSLNSKDVGSTHIYVSGFVTNGEYFEDNDNIEVHLYSVAGEKVAKEQWDAVVSGYKNAPNHLRLYGDDQSNLDETVDRLLTLYEKYNDSPTELLLDEAKIEEIEWYTYYTNYMSGIEALASVKDSEIGYFALVNMAIYYFDGLGELYDEEEYTYQYPKLKIDEWIYDNFGVRIDDQKLNEHILKYEEEYEKGYGTEFGLISLGVHDEYYTISHSVDGITVFSDGGESLITTSHQLDDDFIALEYVYSYIKELSIMNPEPDYIIVKKVEAANGETYYPYIDTVQNLETIDYDALNKYAEMLDVVKDHKQVESVEEPIDKQNEEALVKESKEQGTTTNSVLYTLVIIGGLVLVVAVVVMNVRKRRSGGKIKKSTTIMMIIFSVIVVGSAIFISINSLQSQTESDTSLGDDTQEDSSSVTDDEQELNDLGDSEVDSSKTEIPEVNDEDTARTFYDDFRNDYENALNTGDFDLVSNYFEDGSAIKQNYKDFVLKHRDWDVDYSYTFLSNTTELEATSANTIVVTAHELFDLYKQDSNPKTSKNDRKRNYTLKLIGNSFYISNIENLDGAPPVKETTKSTNSGTKSDYMASIQYAENLWDDAYAGIGEFHQVELKQGLWVTYEVWDDELNRIYGLLKEELSPQKMEVLRNEQRAWIKERDERTADPDEIGYLTRIELLNDLTRDRTLYLIDMYFDEE